MAHLPVLICQYKTFGGRCHAETTRAMRSPSRVGQSSQTSYVCEEHAERLASLGWLDVTSVELRSDCLITRMGGESILKILGY